jgi:hypothetical protein
MNKKRHIGYRLICLRKSRRRTLTAQSPWGLIDATEYTGKGTKDLAASASQRPSASVVRPRNPAPQHGRKQLPLKPHSNQSTIWTFLCIASRQNVLVSISGEELQVFSYRIAVA